MFLTMAIGFLVFGLIIGSFLNVVLFRYNTGRGLGGRSKCFSCKRNLSPIDLVPVFSFLAFKGRCRTCKAKISWQYPAVELLTGLAFLLAFLYAYPLLDFSPFQFVVQTVYLLCILSVLVIITVYDIRHKIIPDGFVLLFACLCFVNMFFTFDDSGYIYLVLPSVVRFLSGFIIAFPFYLFWLISSGRWMGLGDAKLVVGFGWLLGIGGGVTAVIYGFWIGASVSLLLMLFGYVVRNSDFLSQRKYHAVSQLSMKTEIPFAPFLILGLLIVMFFRYNMFSVFYL